MKYRICPDCNAHLDHGERCDCRKENAAPPLTREKPQRKLDAVSLSVSTTKVNERDTEHGYQ